MLHTANKKQASRHEILIKIIFKLVHRRRRWNNYKTTLVQRFLFATQAKMGDLRGVII